MLCLGKLRHRAVSLWSQAHRRQKPGKEMVSLTRAPRETVGFCGDFPRKHRNAPSPAPPELPGTQTVFFPPQQIAFRIFSLRPVEEHGSDRFSWLSYPAICNYKMVGKFPLTCGDLEHISGISLRTRLRSREWALPVSASGPQTRGPPHTESHKNSKTT